MNTRTVRPDVPSRAEPVLGFIRDIIDTARPPEEEGEAALNNLVMSAGKRSCPDIICYLLSVIKMGDQGNFGREGNNEQSRQKRFVLELQYARSRCGAVG